MGNVTVVVQIDVAPSTYDLQEVSLWTAGKGFMIRQADIKSAQVGQEIKWTKLENVWYDFYLMDNKGRYVYGLKGKYCTQTTYVKLSQIIEGQKLPSPN